MSLNLLAEDYQNSGAQSIMSIHEVFRNAYFTHFHWKFN